MRPNIRPISAIIILAAISVLTYSILLTCDKEIVHEQEVGIVPEMAHASWGWGKIPKQNQCPHCGEWSFTRFCPDCGKERGNLPFIGVYCPKCNPKGNYARTTGNIDDMCGDCGGKKTWKYVYEDWQDCYLS